MRMLHDVFKGFHIEAGGFLGRDRIPHEPVVLAVVQCKMFDGNADALTLHAIHFRRAEHSREVRVFREILEIPAAERIPL